MTDDKKGRVHDFLEASRRQGLKTLPPDDPFYSRGASIIIRSRPSGGSAFLPPPPPPPPSEDRPLPACPPGFKCVFPGWGSKPRRGVPRRTPGNAVNLGWVGWNWGPSSERYDDFNLSTSRDGKYWLLHLNTKDDWCGTFDRGQLAAYGPRAAATEFEAAVHLLATVWCENPSSETEGVFHEVHGEGLLSTGEFEAIAELAQLQRDGGTAGGKKEA